jgi:diguanylate cyclase
MLIILILLQAIVAVWWGYLQLTPDKTTLANYLFNGVYGATFLYGGLLGLFNGLKLGGFRSTVGRSITIISVGLILYALGQYSWLVYNLVLDSEVPYPSIADIFFVLSMPLFAIGFWLILRMYRTFLSAKMVVQLIIGVVIWSALTALVVGTPDLSGDLVSRFLNSYYPFGDAVLASLAFITFRTGGGKIDRSILMFVAGMLLLAAGDIVFTFRNNNETYWNGDISDILFAASGFFICLGVIRTIKSFQTGR